MRQLLDEMPYEELQGWILYLKKRPIGWQEDSRTFKLLQAQGVKAAPELLFPSLEPIYKVDPAAEKTVSVNNLKNSVFFQMMSQAKDGDKLNIFGG